MCDERPSDEWHRGKCGASPGLRQRSRNVSKQRGSAARNLSPALAVSLERIVLILRTTMLRKPLTLAIVLVIAGLAPAAAIIGFCTRMPCCSHAANATPALATERGDCCT